MLYSNEEAEMNDEQNLVHFFLIAFLVSIVTMKVINYTAPYGMCDDVVSPENCLHIKG